MQLAAFPHPALPEVPSFYVLSLTSSVQAAPFSSVGFSSTGSLLQEFSSGNCSLPFVSPDLGVASALCRHYFGVNSVFLLLSQFSETI